MVKPKLSAACIYPMRIKTLGRLSVLVESSLVLCIYIIIFLMNVLIYLIVLFQIVLFSFQALVLHVILVHC